MERRGVVGRHVGGAGSGVGEVERDGHGGVGGERGAGDAVAEGGGVGGGGCVTEGVAERVVEARLRVHGGRRRARARARGEQP